MMSAHNMSALWRASWASVHGRIRRSGFLPTSVCGGRLRFTTSSW